MLRPVTPFLHAVTSDVGRRASQQMSKNSIPACSLLVVASASRTDVTRVKKDWQAPTSVPLPIRVAGCQR